MNYDKLASKFPANDTMKNEELFNLKAKTKQNIISYLYNLIIINYYYYYYYYYKQLSV